MVTSASDILPLIKLTKVSYAAESSFRASANSLRVLRASGAPSISALIPTVTPESISATTVAESIPVPPITADAIAESKVN